MSAHPRNVHQYFRLALMVAFSLFLVLETVSRGAEPARPNILFIFADDMGYGDVGAFNPKSKTPTPNIDRLAAEGMRFTDAHTPGAVCIPSRYGLLTGRYPFRATLRPDVGPVIEPGRMTVASLLARHGYATAMIGKWHLGFEGGIAFNYAEPLRGGPVDHGFESFFGVHASTDIPPYFYIEGDRTVTPPTQQIAENHSPGWSPIQGAFWRAGYIAPDMKLAEVLPEFTTRAVNWLERRDRSDSPFFFYLALTAPHTPWLPTDEFRRRSSIGPYGDFVAQVDDCVGQVLAALQRRGLDQDTLVIFTSDNGPTWYPEDVERWGHSSTHVYRGMKGDLWEGGHRMPFVARWPGHIRAGSSSSQLLCFTDLLATTASLVGAELPDDAGEDSFSFLPALLDTPWNQPPRETLIVRSARGILTIRDGNWKLIETLGSGGFTQPAVIEPSPGGPTGQLYDLAADPSETNDLWTQRPDVVARLTALVDKQRNDGRSRPAKAGP